MESLKIGPKNHADLESLIRTDYVVGDFEWNAELEKKFQKEKKTAKFKYFSFVNNSSFN